jgi:hypothetical protein
LAVRKPTFSSSNPPANVAVEPPINDNVPVPIDGCRLAALKSHLVIIIWGLIIGFPRIRYNIAHNKICLIASIKSITIFKKIINFARNFKDLNLKIKPPK